MEWIGADRIIREYNEQVDYEFMYGKNSIHAKYTAFIEERERRLAAEDAAYKKMMADRAARKAKQASEEIIERS